MFFFPRVAGKSSGTAIGLWVVFGCGDVVNLSAIRLSVKNFIKKSVQGANIFIYVQCWEISSKKSHFTSLGNFFTSRSVISHYIHFY